MKKFMFSKNIMTWNLEKVVKLEKKFELDSSSSVFGPLLSITNLPAEFSCKYRNKVTFCICRIWTKTSSAGSRRPGKTCWDFVRLGSFAKPIFSTDFLSLFFFFFLIHGCSSCILENCCLWLMFTVWMQQEREKVSTKSLKWEPAVEGGSQTFILVTCLSLLFCSHAC